MSATGPAAPGEAVRGGRPRVSVVMPTYDQEAFLPAAVHSVRAQSMEDWELVIVDDGSPGDPAGALGDALGDPRISLVTLTGNTGLGAALNRGLDETTGAYVAYLPSDDTYFAGHLASLADALDAHPGAPLACSGIRHHEHQSATGRIPGEPLQLAQVMHRRTPARWLERGELTTDDLDRMLWNRLLGEGKPLETG